MSQSSYTSAASDSIVGLSEAQTTIALTGINEQIWTAFGLVDSTRELAVVREYDAEPLSCHGQREDPIAGKALGPDNRAFNPRLYFLWAWEARIAQIDAEWDRIVGCVDRTVREYVPCVLYAFYTV